MALKPAKEKCYELMNFYYEEAKKHCISKPEKSILDLAISLTKHHCNEMISFIDSEMKGWLDWDMKAYYEQIIELADNFPRK